MTTLVVCSRAGLTALLLSVIAAAAWPREARGAAADPLLLRVFLLDGTSLVSYGEYARMGDRVIVSLPLGPPSQTPRLHLVSLPAALVDWPLTEQYARAARRAHYAATRGPADFAALQAELAEMLSALGRETDPERRLVIAKHAQQRLLTYPGMQYGYRAEEVRQIAALVEELVAGLRAASGAARFDLQLVAHPAPPTVALLPPPSLQEIIAQVLAAARYSPVPAERLSLLHSVEGLLETYGAALPARWVRETGRRAERARMAELRVERAYRQLADSALQAASDGAAQGDVMRVERVIARVVRRDRDLGARRQDEIASLIATLHAHLAAAQARRLDYDRWRLRLPAFQAYEAAVGSALDRFRRVRRVLDQIRRLAGPEGVDLVRAEARLREARTRWAGPVPPVELATVHDLVGRALALGLEAVRIRRQAIERGDFDHARAASSAAAGSLLLFDRARTDLARALAGPTGK